MKKNITLLLTALLTISACGTSAQLASTSRMFEDGIYSRPTTQATQDTHASDMEVAELVRQTRESESFRNAGTSDSLFTAEKADKAPVTFADRTVKNSGDSRIVIEIDPFLGYSPWYGYSWYRSRAWYGPIAWDPWYYSYASPWRWSSWYWSYWYYDPWFSPYFGWDPYWYGGPYWGWDPYWYGGWYGPGWYAGWYGPGWHGGWYGPGWYGGWYGPGWAHGHYVRERSHNPRGTVGNRSTGLGSTSGSSRLRTSIASNAVRNNGQGSQPSATRSTLNAVRRTSTT
ncbi:MAG: hypothetical protein PUB91_04960, partial [Bacteroidales bacterium]|nr:hypothetical protein [Bacteroidales bacterium]